jgi:hypothetical protein
VFITITGVAGGKRLLCPLVVVGVCETTAAAVVVVIPLYDFALLRFFLVMTRYYCL